MKPSQTERTQGPPTHIRAKFKPEPPVQATMLEAMTIALGVFAVAFLFAPVGMGGGMLFVPLFHYSADWPIDGTLIATSLLLTTVVSFGSGLAHRKKGHYNDEAIKSALVGAVPGAMLGVLVVVLLGARLDPVFKTLSVAMLVWALVKTQRKLRQTPSDTDQTVSNQPNQPIEHWPMRAGTGVGGMLSSVLAVGAGVIYVPVLQQKAHLEPRTSIGSSLHIMMAVVPVAILTHLAFISSAELDAFLTALPFLLGLMVLTYIGANAGARFGMRYISPANIMKLFMMLVVIVLVRYVADLGGTLLGSI